MSRIYRLNDSLSITGYKEIICKDDHDCVFCKHCEDIFWDYSNLIYLIICGKGHDWLKRPCNDFEEDQDE